MKELMKNQSLEEIIKTNDNVLVDFNAEWCGPCKMLKPILEQLAKTTPDVVFVSVDCDVHKELAATFSVTALPTLVMFKDGKEVNKKIGFLSHQGIVELLNS